ncbi:MAG: ferritin [Phycisphaeraceae bacterium]
MLDAKIEAALNKQINHEITAAYHYLAMAAWCEHESLTGFASWMKLQRQEELKHAQRFFDYLNDRGGTVALQPIEAPKGKFKSPKDVFLRAFELEQINTKAIYDLYQLALDLKDFATQSMLKWFIDEQVEEEKTAREIEDLLELAADNKSALLLLNRQLGERTAAE